MKQNDLQDKYKWICETFFSGWDNTCWQISYADMPVFDGIVLGEQKKIVIASRLTGDKIILVIIHEVAHAVTATRGHLPEWKNAIIASSEIASKNGCRKLAKQLRHEAEHKGVTDDEESVYQFASAWCREHSDMSYKL